MTGSRKIALVSHGDREAREASLSGGRLGKVGEAMLAAGLAPEAAVYNDDFADEVKNQLLQVDGVLVWVNPVDQGRTRTKLDKMLREVASTGVFVSAHPDTIQKMGTKDVLYDTRSMAWGSDVRRYATWAEMREQLPHELASGKARVLKQHRGHSGNGVWKVALHTAEVVKVRHAARGSIEAEAKLDDFLETCRSWFDDGAVIDQAYQERLKDGMIRCYLVRDQVAGFGHQEVNALFPAPEGAPPEEAPQPGPRLYHPPTKAEFQDLRRLMESQWVAEMLRALKMDRSELPMLWDADFFLGSGDQPYVLGEINVSSVFPFPDDALEPLAKAVAAELSHRQPAAIPG